MTAGAEPRGPRANDVVVIACRGASARFGRPKALAVVGSDPRPLLARVTALYTATGAGLILVVTTVDLAPSCREVLAGVAAGRCEVLAGPGGGGTALTMALAHERLRGRAGQAGHVWAHPVDLPRVRPATLAQLARVAARAPGRVVRPRWGTTPGHPLLMPATVFRRLATGVVRGEEGNEGPGAGDWRGVIAAAVADGTLEPVLSVDVADPGTVLDHDEPPAPGAPRREE